MQQAGLVDPSLAEREIEKIAVDLAAREKNEAEQGRARRISARRCAERIDSDAEAYTRHQVDSILHTTSKLEQQRAKEGTRRKRGRRPSRAQRRAAHQRARAKNAERNDKRQNRYKRRTQEHVERFRQSLQARGQQDARPVGIPARVWRLAQLCGDAKHFSQLDRERAARIGLAQLPKTAAERLLKAAFRPEPYQPTRRFRDRELHQCERESLPRRDWNHPSALKTVLLGLLMWHLGESTKRRGFAKAIRGYGRGVFAALLQNWATGQHASVHHLFGASREVPGPALALAQAGFLHRNQPPAELVSARDRGPSGHAYNVYWLYSVGLEHELSLLDLLEAPPEPTLEPLTDKLATLERMAPF